MSELVREWVEKAEADIVSNAQRMLGYDPKTSIEEGIVRFVRWWGKAR